MPEQWFEITRTRRGWRPRMRSRNYKVTWWAQHYSSRDEAVASIERLTTLFYPGADTWPKTHPTEVRVPGRHIPIVDIDKRVLGR